MPLSDLLLLISIPLSLYGTYLLARSILTRNRDEIKDSAPGWTGGYYSGSLYFQFVVRSEALTGLLFLALGITTNSVAGLSILQVTVSRLLAFVSFPMILVVIGLFHRLAVGRRFRRRALVRMIVEERWNRQGYWDEHSWNRALEFLSRRSLLSDNLRSAMAALLLELSKAVDSQLKPNLSTSQRNEGVDRFKLVGMSLIKRAVTEELNVQWT